MTERVAVQEPSEGDREDVRRSVVQVLDERGGCVGTGFLVQGGLLVSCAHVITSAGAPPDGPVTVRFAHLDGQDRPAEVVPAWWRNPAQGDIAVLRLVQPPPDQAQPLRLAEGVIPERRVRTFGFPSNAPAQGQYSYAVVGHQLTSEAGQPLRQLRDATEITEGFSGAPVLDERTGLVVGMIDSVAPPDRLARGTATAYLTPAERLRTVCPQLPAPGVRPYRGLAPFTHDDTAWFFGRDHAVTLVLERLHATPACRTLALLGPSGSGKTSLVQAGVLPVLAGGALPGSRRWASLTTRPGSDPFAELERAGLPDADQGLPDAASRWLADHPDHDRLLVVLDQFEELFSSSIPPTERRQLLNQLSSDTT
jgi:Trypsin-like peptidase domain